MTLKRGKEKIMNTNRIELNMDELKTVNGGTTGTSVYPVPDGTWARAGAAVVSGAVSGSGISNGTYRPGGAIMAAIGGAMGATASLINFFFGD